MWSSVYTAASWRSKEVSRTGVYSFCACLGSKSSQSKAIFRAPCRRELTHVLECNSDGFLLVDAFGSQECAALRAVARSHGLQARHNCALPIGQQSPQPPTIMSPDGRLCSARSDRSSLSSSALAELGSRHRRAAMDAHWHRQRCQARTHTHPPHRLARGHRARANHKAASTRTQCANADSRRPRSRARARCELRPACQTSARSRSMVYLMSDGGQESGRCSAGSARFRAGCTHPCKRNQKGHKQRQKRTATNRSV